MPFFRLPLKRALVAALLSLVLPSSILADDHASSRGERQDSTLFEESTTVIVVEIPVQVHRRGAPVRGLTRNDFEVFEGDHELEIVGFEAIDLGNPQPSKQPQSIELARASKAVESSPEPPDARRYLAMMFDLSTRRRALIRALEGARANLDQLQPEDRVAIGVFGLRGFVILSDFDDDRAMAEQVLSQLQKHSLTNRVASHFMFPEEATLSCGEISGRRSDFRRWAANLSHFAETTKTWPGNRHLLLYTDGFDNRLFYAVENCVDGASRARRNLENLGHRLRESGWILQTVQTLGLVSLSTNGALESLALETGGKVWRNYNRLDIATDELVAYTEVTYMLVLQPDNVRLDGAFHSIQVRLKNKPRGTTLSYRKGFDAPGKDPISSP